MRWMDLIRKINILISNSILCVEYIVLYVAFIYKKKLGNILQFVIV